MTNVDPAVQHGDKNSFEFYGHMFCATDDPFVCFWSYYQTVSSIYTSRNSPDKPDSVHIPRDHNTNSFRIIS